MHQIHKNKFRSGHSSITCLARIWHCFSYKHRTDLLAGLLQLFTFCRLLVFLRLNVALDVISAPTSHGNVDLAVFAECELVRLVAWLNERPFLCTLFSVVGSPFLRFLAIFSVVDFSLRHCE